MRDDGTATRQRAPQSRVVTSEAARRLVDAFTGEKARLLVTSGGRDHEPLIEVAHEALLRSWPRLADWIADTKDDHSVLRQVRIAADQWQVHDQADAYRWPDERLQPVYRALENLGLDPAVDLSATERAFIRPETERLLAELDDIETPHARRSTIGERLCVIGGTIGDPRPGVGLRPDGLPDIAWCAVPGGEVTLEKGAGTFPVAPFYIAKYPITYVQFQVFLDDPDGFQRDEWWEGMPEKYRKQAMDEQRFKFANHPRETVIWYQAVAFCRWLTARLPGEAWPEEALIPHATASLPLLPQGEGEKYRAMARQTMVQIARQLRQRQTDAESLLWECLRDRRLAGIKFRRQHPVAQTGYVVDFFSYDAGLVVEIDGPIHDRQRRADLERRAHLEKLGFRVMRFTNEQVFTDLETVLAQIVLSAQVDQVPLPEGEGFRVRAKWGIRLPTEWEWQQAATGGDPAREYPWGPDWDGRRCNTRESGLSRTTAAGMYPHGAAPAPVGALDMSGNVWEWCQNEYENPENTGPGGTAARVLRGGSWSDDANRARCAYRSNRSPSFRYFSVGVRVACSAPMF